MLNAIPIWVGAIGALLVIASTLGAAVALYKNSLQATRLENALGANDDLRLEMIDKERRHEQERRDYKEEVAKLEHEHAIKVTELNGQIGVLTASNENCNSRVTVLEDLLSRRKDDDQLRAEVASLKSAVDDKVLAILTSINDRLVQTSTDAHNAAEGTAEIAEEMRDQK